MVNTRRKLKSSSFCLSTHPCAKAIIPPLTLAHTRGARLRMRSIDASRLSWLSPGYGCLVALSLLVFPGQLSIHAQTTATLAEAKTNDFILTFTVLDVGDSRPIAGATI